MPEVIFKEGDAEPRAVMAPEGGSLADLCDEVDAPVPFGCRGATCGMCRIVILEGQEQLLPAQDDELSLLAVFASPPSHRLACQARMRPGTARLVLRPVNDDE